MTKRIIRDAAFYIYGATCIIGSGALLVTVLVAMAG